MCGSTIFQIECRKSKKGLVVVEAVIMMMMTIMTTMTNDSSMANAGSGFSSALCRDPESNTCPRNALLPACARKCQIPFALTPSRVREYMMKGDERRLVHGP